MDWKQLSNAKRTGIALTAVLLATGVVFATGAFLAQIPRDQVINELVITTTPAGASTTWPAAVAGAPFAFVVTVTNPTTQVVGLIHLNLVAGCFNGLLDAVITGPQIIDGGSGTDMCDGGFVHSTSKSLGASPASVAWDFVVTYSPAGTADWTFTARLG